MTWNERTQAALLPNDGDLARAMAMAVGLATADTDLIDLSTYEAAQLGRLPQMQLAAGELLVRAYNLRDDENALADWRIAIAKHRNDELRGNQ